MIYDTMKSPVGTLLLTATERTLTGLYLQNGRYAPAIEPTWTQVENAPIAEAKRQLAEYFAGGRMAFDLPLAPDGTEFQKRVWNELARIPHGETTTYGCIARQIGQPTAARAVGLANGRNPISIIVPCHRVVGSGGALTGYSGGLSVKEALLAHERKSVPALF